MNQAIQDEGQDPDEFMFDIVTTSAKKTPKAAAKSGAKDTPTKEEEKEEAMETDELIIKDETDEQPDGDFEEVDQVGEIEKEVNLKIRKFESVIC
jgi:hypothetical protein